MTRRHLNPATWMLRTPAIAVRGLLVLSILCGLVLMPVHAHDDFSAGSADDICQLCVHGSSGHVGHEPLIGVFLRPQRPDVPSAFSVAEAAMPVRVCRGPPLD